MYRDSFEAFSQGKEMNGELEYETPLDTFEDCDKTFLLDEE